MGNILKRNEWTRKRITNIIPSKQRKNTRHFLILKGYERRLIFTHLLYCENNIIFNIFYILYFIKNKF